MPDQFGKFAAATASKCLACGEELRPAEPFCFQCGYQYIEEIKLHYDSGSRGSSQPDLFTQTLSLPVRSGRFSKPSPAFSAADKQVFAPVIDLLAEPPLIDLLAEPPLIDLLAEPPNAVQTRINHNYASDNPRRDSRIIELRWENADAPTVRILLLALLLTVFVVAIFLLSLYLKINYPATN